MRGVLQLFYKSSKDLFWNCSRTNLLTLARTFVEQKNVPFNVLHLSHKRSRTYLEQF